MTDDELLLAVTEDKIRDCNNKNILTYSYFLDIRQQSIVSNFLNKRKISHCFYGGFEDSERQIVVFFPEYISDITYLNENSDDNPLCLLLIIKDNFSSLSHRDYLGALMGLGVKREMIGDILVNDKGCVISTFKTIGRYIKENLVSVGRGTVKTQISDDFSKYKSEEIFELKKCFVSSMRADSVLAAAFNISRGSAIEYIRRKEVFLDGVEVNKNDKTISIPSKLVIHGKGKVIIFEDEGTTKKGRHCFSVKKY